MTAGGVFSNVIALTQTTAVNGVLGPFHFLVALSKLEGSLHPLIALLALSCQVATIAPCSVLRPISFQGPCIPSRLPPHLRPRCNLSNTSFWPTKRDCDDANYLKGACDTFQCSGLSAQVLRANEPSCPTSCFARKYAQAL